MLMVANMPSWYAHTTYPEHPYHLGIFATYGGFAEEPTFPELERFFPDNKDRNQIAKQRGEHHRLVFAPFRLARPGMSDCTWWIPWLCRSRSLCLWRSSWRLSVCER